MKKELIQQFAFRVTQANQSQLVVLVYDIIQEDIKSAYDAYESKDMEAFLKELKHAQKFVLELMNTLDCQYEIGLDLMSLYLYINKQIIQAIIRRDTDSLEGLIDIVGQIKYAFEEISREDNSSPVMINTEQVYAGLTYHKGNLNETYLNQNSNKRGFTV